MQKQLLAAAGLALGTIMSSAMVGQAAQAAPVKSPFCQYAKSEKNPVSWNAYYHCLGSAPQARPHLQHTRLSHAQNPYCNLAKGQKNPVSWNAIMDA